MPFYRGRPCSMTIPMQSNRSSLGTSALAREGADCPVGRAENGRIWAHREEEPRAFASPRPEPRGEAREIDETGEGCDPEAGRPVGIESESEAAPRLGERESRRQQGAGREPARK